MDEAYMETYEPGTVLMTEPRLNYKLGYWGKGKSVKLKFYGPKTVEYLYNIKQAAEFCECTEQTIRRWVTIGLLPSFKQMVDPEIPATEATKGLVYFRKGDLVNALRVGLGVPTEGFNVEDHGRNRNPD